MRTLRARLEPYGYLAPALATMIVLSFVPIAYSVFIAFTNYDLYHFTTYHWVGLANFAAILTGPYATVFLPTLGWTVVFSFGTTILNFLGGLGLALLLNQPWLKFKGFFRTLLIVPWALPSTITILIWSGLLNQTFGPVDQFLTHLGLPAIPWLTDPFWAKVAILLVNLWLGYPFFMVSLLGGLQSIGQDTLEAAAIDGANPWQRFRFITFPLLWRFSLPLLMGTFAYNFNNFGIVYLLTGGGPPRIDTSFAGSTDVLSTVIYNMTLTYYRYDIAAAFGIILFVILALLTLAQYRWLGGLGQLDAL
jgi:arabinogalactan oligomer/maltooligosaccharide transport system permease protein